MYWWFGARLLRPAELPELFNILAEVCGRAGLSRLPDLYCLAAPRVMNAYAPGGPEGRKKPADRSFSSPPALLMLNFAPRSRFVGN